MERSWPIGNCEAGVVAGDQGAGDEEQKRSERDQRREAMVRLVIRCG
jgi:hypothetical protein